MGFQSQANVLYDLVAQGSVDGIVIWASSIGNYVTVDEMRAFHERYHPLPVVTIGMTLEGIPSLLMESYEGMCEALVHLIEVHGYRRLAFIRGPEGHLQAQERYRAYTDVLQAYGLPFDPNLVTLPLGWDRPIGREAMRLLLDERRLRPQVDVEAIVAANDHLLLGALEVLRERGIQVPGQVAVVGFDDIMLGRTNTPPFTSVAAPYYEIGYQAMETLLARIAGQPVPEQVKVPCRFVVRQSCGCTDPEVKLAAVDRERVAEQTLDAALAARRSEILAEIVKAMGDTSRSVAADWVGRLLDSLAAELGGKSSGIFIRALDQVLQQVALAGGDVAPWQKAITAMQQQVLPYLDGDALLQAGNLWQQARISIGKTAQRLEAHRAVQSEQQAQMLREISQALITTLDMQELIEVLAERLPQLGIPSGYLSLYEDPQKPTEWSRLLLAYNDRGRIPLEPEGRRFPSRQLAPEGMLSQERRYTFVVEPLYFRDQQLGFALLKVGPREGYIYDALRGQISGALQGALLVQRVQERSEELARQQYILDTFMNNIPDHIYFKDTQSRFLRVSQSMVNMFGLTDPTQAVGKTDFDFFLEDHARPAYETEQEIMRTGQPVLGLEERETWPDRPDTWVMTSKLPMRDEQGRIIGTFGISRDITDLKRAQQAQERRARELQAAAQVSRAASSILDTNELIQQTVNLIRDHFGLYYVGLFLLDPDGHLAVLRAGTGQAGQQMVEQGHKLQVGEASMIGWCIAHRQARIALDVGEEAVRFSNPLLPATRSELALPLISRGRVIGAMTVQSDRAAAFDQDNITVLQTLADQVANAIENARLFAEIQQAEAKTQQALQELERLYRATSREGWQAMREAGHLPTGYVFDRGALELNQDLWLPEIEQAVRQNSLVQPTTLSSALASPLSVRGEVIGALGVLGDPRHRLLPEDIELVASVSEQVALALENARLFEQTQLTLAETQALYQASADITAAQTYDQVLAALCRHTILGQADLSTTLSLFDVPWLTDRPPRWINNMAQVGKLAELIAPQYELSQMPTMGLLQRDEPTLAGDLTSDPNMDETTRDLIVNLLQARSAAFVPLVAGGQWIGYVGALWSLPQTFAEADVRRLRALTSQAATVVQNIKQLTETQTRARREQILREVTARVRGSTDPDTVMRTLARELGTALGRPTFVRLVTDKGAQEPEPSPSGGNGQRR